MKFTKLFSFLLVMVMMFSFTTSTTLAASSSKTVTSRDTMSLSLAKQASGDSNVITFNFSGLPSDAVVTKVVVDANSGITYGGNGAIVSNRVHIKNESMDNYTFAPWGSLNKTEITTGVIGKPAAGTWSIYYNGTNVSTLGSAWKSYASPKLTVYYSY
ncbi:hypothetical protein FJQ98_00960 [Lysinibacillus agricola]|uniref:DUF4879 domain-containing protein n=1 Tax=Lysinibacillus agricola TaxID=2590012 RepID=A0ABX7AST2_9BACI|nr:MULTISPECIES: hypothetical protein [Lysinibacillus]KOS64536.1 hypothetical protein AN161_01615 [Lysinibacillus sp. FJAT-14222]QQP12716.1 hypothetical protein FJQ98_00960 [Lysinibacillus agricola]